jgi:metallo-beta-lactamase family protein
MPLLLKFHGALTTVTGSCHFFKVKASGNIYAVDCGVTQGEDDEEQLAIPSNLPKDCHPEKLSGIILTHAHGDHVNHLPRWFQAGFRGQIFCTRETAILAAISLQNSRRIEKNEHGNEVPGESFRATLDALMTARHVPPGKPQTLEFNVTIQSAPTSHLLGCCAFRIEARDGNKTCSVLFTGDIGPVEHSDETLSLYAERQRHELPADYIISESTYGSRPRKPESQSGRRRQERMCEVLSKGFRHGDKSLVIIPAFSLQRSLDILVDVFCALQYRRTKVGLHKSAIPKIVVRSKLSWDFAEAYRDFFFSELGNPCFFNEKSLLIQTITEAGDDEAGVFNDLIPESKSSVITRYDEAHEAIQTEVVWGQDRGPYNGPTVVICGSGMTLAGPIVELIDDNLSNDEATFVLCGYVPANSPGSQLREISPLTQVQRAAKAIKLPKDKKSGRPAKTIPGDEVKCGYESLSEFYSGHADGKSVIRYILGDGLERASVTKGVFLVHGDKGARAELKQLIAEACGEKGLQAPPVYMPNPFAPWFDCETGDALADPMQASTDPGAPQRSWVELSEGLLPAGPAGNFPEEVYLATCVIVSSTLSTEDTIDQIKGAFDYARPEVRGNHLILKVSRPGRPHSTAKVEADRIGESLLKVSVQLRIRQIETLADISVAAFDWRRLLNLLGVPKELYYAGIRWCQTDAEADRLLALCVPSVYGNKQRRQPVLFIHVDTLSHEERQALERLLTPAVVLAVVSENFVAKINAALGIAGDSLLTRTNPVYLPIKHLAGVHSLSTPEHSVDLLRLAEIVTADTFILNAREPQLSRSGKPSPLTSPPAESLGETTAAIAPAATVKQKSPQPSHDLYDIPAVKYMEVAIGQKVVATVEYIKTKQSTGEVTFSLLRLKELGLQGILHVSQMAGPFQGKEGDTYELWIRQVSPEKRKINFTQHPVRAPIDKLKELVEGPCDLTPYDIVNLLGDKATVDLVCQAANESFRAQDIPDSQVLPSSLLPRPTSIDTYNRLIQELGLIEPIAIPPPEPTKGLTYGEVAKELGYTLEDLVNAATHMLSDEPTYHLGMAVLPAGFTPAENSVFPADYKDAFIQECHQRAENGWSKDFDLDAALKPDCLSLGCLAASMGITESELLSLMSVKGIQPKVQVVLTPQDIAKLKA